MKKLLIFLLIIGVFIGTGYLVNNYSGINDKTGIVKDTNVNVNNGKNEKIYSDLDCHLFRDKELLGTDPRVEDIIKIAENNPECKYTAMYSGHSNEMSLYEIKEKSRLDGFDVYVNNHGESVNCVVKFK